MKHFVLKFSTGYHDIAFSGRLSTIECKKDLVYVDN